MVFFGCRFKFSLTAVKWNTVTTTQGTALNRFTFEINSQSVGRVQGRGLASTSQDACLLTSLHITPFISRKLARYSLFEFEGRYMRPFSFLFFTLPLGRACPWVQPQHMGNHQNKLGKNAQRNVADLLTSSHHD